MKKKTSFKNKNYTFVTPPSKSNRLGHLDESTTRYAIASRLHIYWRIFKSNIPKDSWFQQLSSEVSILKIRL